MASFIFPSELVHFLFLFLIKLCLKIFFFFFNKWVLCGHKNSFYRLQVHQVAIHHWMKLILIFCLIGTLTKMYSGEILKQEYRFIQIVLNCTENILILIISPVVVFLFKVPYFPHEAE